jgi:hypothetical protein
VRVATGRLRLWELDADRHGPLLGSCWSAAQLRRLGDKFFAGRSSLDDFELHVAAAAQCATRNKLSLALQRALDRDAAPWLRRAAAAATTLQLGQLQRVHEVPPPLAPAVQQVEGEAVAPLPLPADALRAIRVLCVGGRSGQVPLYRELVERHGGHFAHHDGGVEDNPHRLDTQLAAADLVLCQSGCLNHNAYSRVKQHCKRSGKPCVYVDKPGAGSFARALGAAHERVAS